MAYFPFFVDIEGKKCLIVGGGRVAYQKVSVLVDYGPEITVIAPEMLPEMEILSEKNLGKLYLNYRKFKDSDLGDVDYVVAGTSDEKVNRRISNLCKERNIPVNVVDVQEECSFIFPALIKDENIVVGISTSGDSPTSAQYLKKRFKEVIPHGFGDLSRQLGSYRDMVKKQVPQVSERRLIFRTMLEEGIRQGGTFTGEQAKELIEREYHRMKLEKSEKLFEESKEYFPGGVNSPVRAFGSVGGVPVFVKEANGSHIYDEDGKEYIDYVTSWGPCILGHAYEPVVEAVREACIHGLSFGAPTRKELILGRLVKECFPSMEMMRMVSSGTEAVMSAIRAARGYTGRNKIVKFIGCYHGHSDGLLVKAGSGALTESAPDSAGVPASYTEHTLLARYNGEDSVKKLFEEFPEDIAAVVVEPVAANMGLIAPKPGFLEFLREITTRYGALLIFDEVITGFRMGIGGAQGYYGVIPDMTTLGKIVGGGMPMGIYGGRKEIMEVVSPAGTVYQAGTLSGNPIATAAGIVTIQTLMEHPEIYKALEEKAKRLIGAIRENLPKACVNQAGSLFSVFFTEESVVDYDSALTSDTKLYARYFHYLLEHGIYTAPSQFEILFLSAAHTDDDINKTCRVIQEAAHNLMPV